jgi:TolB-like protein/tetratricopeptide (TPR) repeat protein
LSLFKELKRRNVFRVGIAYVIAAWLILQVVDIVQDILSLPEWAGKFVLLLLVIGLPLALIFAWAFELTPDGIKRESEVDRAQSIQPQTGKKLDPVRDTELVEAATEAVASEAVEQAEQTEEIDNSIAVLPFVNMSDEASNEYFSDGISEELLILLTKVTDLRVIARTSSFAFKGKDATIADVARELNVTHVLEGSVRKSGNQVRITAQLIRASDSTHLWSESYDRTLEDIFTIQDEIAVTVVAQLKITLLGVAPTMETANPAAYALILQARQVGNQGTPESLEQSIVLVKQALEIDPEYANGWATLADFYMARRFHEGWDHGDIRSLAREATNHALSINPSSATAHMLLGLISMVYDCDLAAAARHYGRALGVDPTNTFILRQASRLNRVFGRATAAIVTGNYLVTVDPLNPLIHANLGWAYVSGGRWDEAITAFRAALKLSPRVIHAQVGIGVTLLRMGEPEAALIAIQQESFDIYKQAGLVMAYHALGKESESDAVLAYFIENYGNSRAAIIAAVLSFRGEADRAFVWLDKAVQNIDGDLVSWLTGGFFFKVHDDPRWLLFLGSIGISPTQLDAIEFNVTLPE